MNAFLVFVSSPRAPLNVSLASMHECAQHSTPERKQMVDATTAMVRWGVHPLMPTTLERKCIWGQLVV